MRLPYLIQDDLVKWYESASKESSDSTQSRYFRAHGLIRLAKLAYALGKPLSESRGHLKESTDAFEHLFSWQGQLVSTYKVYSKGKLVERTDSSLGYSRTDVFNAALASLILQDVARARALVEVAGYSPMVERDAWKPGGCAKNEEALSIAMNALLFEDWDFARTEAGKFQFRKANQMEKQIGAILYAIADAGDVVSQLDALLFYHGKLAKSRNNWNDSSLYLCLPALGLSNLAVHFGKVDFSNLRFESIYYDSGLLREA